MNLNVFLGNVNSKKQKKGRQVNFKLPCGTEGRGTVLYKPCPPICHNKAILLDELYLSISYLSKEECNHPVHKYNIEAGRFAAMNFKYLMLMTSVPLATSTPNGSGTKGKGTVTTTPLVTTTRTSCYRYSYSNTTDDICPY